MPSSASIARTAPYWASASDPMRDPGPVVLTVLPHQLWAASCANSGRLPPGASNIEVRAMMKPCSDDAAQVTDDSGTSATA